MMKGPFKILLLWLLTAPRLLAQTPTYAADIQPIITQHCAPCHHPGGLGPFSLLTYEDVAKRGKFVAKVTQIRYMPPFPADRQFQHYANERGLSESEINTIRAWVQGGMVRGKEQKKTSQGQGAEGSLTNKESSILTPLPPVRTPDLVLRMKPYGIRGDAREDFRYFHIPMGLLQDIWVEAIEFVPGNRKLLHHSRLMIDSTGTMAGIDGITEEDPRLRDFQKTPLADEFLYGWVPGNDRVTFPEGAAKRIRAGSDLILNIHYSPSAKADQDQSEVRLYFARKPVERVVKTLTLTENNVTNQPFQLPANTKPTFYMNYGPLPDTIRLLSVLPHMHRLGKSVRAFAITPDGNVINLIKIDAWDYNWQLSYFFQNPLVLPKGTTIIAEASYDNTDQNPINPNRPARTVGYGWSSTDEMMNLVFYYIK
ncbi:monooxygenase [Spirosoma pulveris]